MCLGSNRHDAIRFMTRHHKKPYVVVYKVYKHYRFASRTGVFRRANWIESPYQCTKLRLSTNLIKAVGWNLQLHPTEQGLVYQGIHVFTTKAEAKKLAQELQHNSSISTYIVVALHAEVGDMIGYNDYLKHAAFKQAYLPDDEWAKLLKLTNSKLEVPA